MRMSARVRQFGPKHGTARRIAQQEKPARADQPDMMAGNLGQPAFQIGRGAAGERPPRADGGEVDGLARLADRGQHPVEG
ncbi:hypothetical protein LTR94_037715, partial [Friedmanniomyces endolithicus]